MISSKLLTNPSSRCLVQAVATPRRSICHKSKLPPKNVRHWPYQTTSWGFCNFFLDPFTEKKFDENSKIIQVEGNIRSGKAEFAKQLAEELGMVYFPQVDLEDLYINKHGYDYRALNPLLPEKLRYCDMEMFHENPARHSVIHMQYHLYRMRIFQYFAALRHLFNTGQGVVLTRTPFTERVFVEAMHEIGWLPLGYVRDDDVRFYDWRNYYIGIRNLSLQPLLKPPLTIYLNASVDSCMERIKNDPDPMIRNSNALTRDFLEAIETAYDDIVLPKQNEIGHVVVADDFKTRDEVLDVIDRIEELDYEFDPHDDVKFKSWESITKLWHMYWRRRVTTLNHLEMTEHLGQPIYDIAGLGDSLTQVDLYLRRSLYESHVADLGYLKAYDSDLRFQNAFKVFMGYMNFGERVDKVMRADFK